MKSYRSHTEGGTVKRTRVLFLILSLSVTSLMAGETPGYERIDIMTASSPASSRSEEWTPGKGIPLEVSGMTWFQGKLAVSIRKGEIWLIGNPLGDDPAEMTYELFASGLHEPLGLLVDDGDLLVAQRAEVTRLKDRDGDGTADAYLTECDGWGVTGNYHAYVYGPARDGNGDLWVTLNLGMGKYADNKRGWRGWGGTIGADGRFRPRSLGMRSPSGIGANLAGDLFFSDQQGTWIPATPIYHLRPGVFYGNQESLATLENEGSPFQLSSVPEPNQPYPDALASSKEFVPPAVWLPYNKMGRSATDVQVIDTDNQFGPFEGQLLVGEFTNSAVSRVFLEKVDGEYQGACFPFLDGFPSAVLRLLFADDGSLMVGMSNRGWSSLGNRSYGLARVRFSGETPFTIREMRATVEGFEVSFTKPVAPERQAAAEFSMQRYTYEYSSKYGGDEMLKKGLSMSDIEWSGNGKSVRIAVADRAPYFVHELHIDGLVDNDGQALKPDRAYYTLNRIPATK